MKSPADNGALAKLGETIRRLRQERGWTQAQLAARAGIHENYLWGIENGKRNVAVLNLLRIASAFEIHPSELWRDFTFGAVEAVRRSRRS